MDDTSIIKILLVDDNENNLLSMRVVLEKDQYAFSSATSGREALRILLKEDDFSLILLDVKMPMMDGYETAELIYQRDKLRHIPIIFITAHDYEEAAIFKGYKAGAVDFVRKPFNPEILRSKVAVFTELYQKNRLLKQQEEKLQLINNDLIQLNQELEQRVLERTIALENLNHELKALNLSKDKFLSVISHDLRNPLTSLLASSENLKRDADKLKPEQIKLLSGIINRTSNKILSQLNELVEWAKNQREKTSFQPVKLHLPHGINESLDLLRETANQKEISLENEVDEDIYIMADALMFRSVLQNLVTNAIKYTPHGGGAVKVSACISGDMVEICIRDNGVGMAESTKAMLFGNSSQTSILGTNMEKGSGLGLLLVKDFITAHGGAINVDTEVDKGTCFRFTLPHFTEQPEL
ncbi:hybrid sensor histidine kinase/response regulator [Mucilaginibacter ginsenosidivorax]|uniref:histidine kinase n=1 Tax=Mucilaginibacter ginsenosidivorax TaxID=862126 RepID=A0A5B8WCE0_9SPHI|nr:hybrid sensor histidine kinase/response regulator [Mucilaginibacter ginsenosidivorax]QEC80232.1 hybrid sensor histidine kinase/response regulator [Mucilaginibacter ginsenosidivorax]